MYNTDLPNRAELPSTGKLLKSTIIAIIVAAVLLVTVVLPAEYGVDPTRIGRVFGLTQMGEIKQKLAIEAKGGRERLESITNMVFPVKILFIILVFEFGEIANQNLQHSTFFQINSGHGMIIVLQYSDYLFI